MKRDLAVYCLELNGRQVFVEPGSRAEGHWVGQGYLAVGSDDPLPGQPPAVEGAVEGDVKPKRRGRKPAAAGEVSDE